MTLFVLPNTPEDTLLEPQTRVVIEDIQWFHIDELQGGGASTPNQTHQAATATADSASDDGEFCDFHK